MGTMVTPRKGRATTFSIIPGIGSVAQVAHPIDISWRPSDAAQLLLQATVRLPETIRLVLTGGGFITLTYPHAAPTHCLMREASFLRQLGEWTGNEILGEIQLIEQSCGNRDFVIGVDVVVNGQGAGQFALWISRGGHAFVAKRFPLNGEDQYLAGFGAAPTVYGPRVIQTSVGPALLLVCHDVQAYNHRNRALVALASQATLRARSIQELDTVRNTCGLAWALNLVHRVGSEENTRTFRRSYTQMRTDFPSVPVNVVGSFGYESSVDVGEVAGLLTQMTSPMMNLPKVVFQ